MTDDNFWEEAARLTGEPWPPPDNSPGKRTHCPQGHPYDNANTFRDRKRNKRACRACGRASAKRHRELAAERHPRLGRMSHAARLELTIQLLNEYGQAKFGDEWWPGNAVPWVGVRKASMMEAIGIDQGESIDDWIRERDS